MKQYAGWNTDEPIYLDSIIPCQLPKIEKRNIESRSFRQNQLSETNFLRRSSSMERIQISKTTQCGSQTCQTSNPTTLAQSFYSPQSTTSYFAYRYPPVNYECNKSPQNLQKKRFRLSVVNFSSSQTQFNINNVHSKQKQNLNKILQRFSKKKY